MRLKNTECKCIVWNGSTDSADSIMNLLSEVADAINYGIDKNNNLMIEYDDGDVVTINLGDVVVYNDFFKCRIITPQSFAENFVV